jgi:hypothetical protein
MKVVNATSGNLVEIFQKYRNSKAKLVLDPSYAQEIEATAELIVEKDAFVHLLMKGGFNQNKFQPSSSFNKYNPFFVKEKIENSEREDTHTALLQYGDPKRAKQQDDLSDWNPVKTLNMLSNNGLEDSLQARVLKDSGFMRIYDIEGLINTNAKTNILAQFFDATIDSITRCEAPVVKTTENHETTEGQTTTESRSSPTPSSCVDGPGFTDILFLIDSSPSMCPYTAAVSEGMKKFVRQIEASGIDTQYAVASFGGVPRVLQAFTVCNYTNSC